MTSSPHADMDPDVRDRIRQQEVVAELGQRALETATLDQLLSDVATTVAQTIETEYAEILELLPAADEFVLRQGVGWSGGVIESTTVETGIDSQAGYTLLSEQPVVVDDLQAEERFSGNELLTAHGVSSGITVIVGSVESPWGVLGVHATTPGEFSEHDANFLQSVANVLAAAIENRYTQHELEEMYGRITDGFYSLDTDWEFTYINDRAEELIDFRAEGLVGENVWEVFDWAADSKLRAAYERAMETQESTSFELYYPDPLDTWFEIHAYPSKTGLSVYFRDSTERKEHEQELELFRTLHDHSNDSVFVLDPDTGRCLDVNETACDRCGYSRAELLKLTVPDLETQIPDHEAWRSLVDELKSSGQTTFDGTRRRKDGTTFPVEVNLAYAELDRAYVLAVARDVTERRERERRLTKSEQQYRTLAENFPNGIVTLFDGDLRYTLAAGQGFETLPVSASELEGETMTTVWPEETAEVLEPTFRAALDGQKDAVELEYAGREWIVRAVPITDDGTVFGGMTIAQDITEHKDRERYLSDAKAQLEAATEAGAIGTWEWHIPDNQMVVGTSFARQFGIDPEEAREGVPLERFITSIHEDDRDRIEREIEAAIESHSKYEAEYRVWNADDELRWVVARGYVEYDEDGNPVTFPGALTDITERKRAEIEVEQQTRQLETLFQVLPVGVVVANGDGSLQRANDAAKEIWDGTVFDAASVEEYEKYSAVWADTGESVAPDEWTMAEVLRGEEVTEPNIYEIETFDGDHRTIMEHGMPVRDGRGTVRRAVVTLTDITERREYQRKLEESNERLEQFAYAASHDLQEPLRMVSSYLQLIERRYADELSSDGEEFIEFATDGAQRMRDMIDGLLEYSRVDTQGGPLEPVELDGVFDDVLDDLQIRLAESDADVTIEDLPVVNGDASQLRQVVQNLLTNAITYSGDEPPRIHVTADRRGQQWVISVHDDGIGIDADDPDRVFEVFERLHTHDEYNGTGIGLALCQRILERHGGRIWVDSEPGDGATFSFTLPAVDD